MHVLQSLEDKDGAVRLMNCRSDRLYQDRAVAKRMHTA
jgi:hypothetical protein